MTKVTPHETYKTYLALKNHFCNDSYDYHKYCGKIKASLQSFHKRKDRLFFERLSRQKKDNEIVDFFVSNFVSSTDPSTLWIGDIIKNGDERYSEWKKNRQSLTYVFQNDLKSLTEEHHILEILKINGNSHPKLLKEYLSGRIFLETMVILDKMLHYKEKFDEKLIDPIWESVSKKIKNYSPFLDIDINKYQNILRKVLL
jgi:hypothetical protein